MSPRRALSLAACLALLLLATTTPKIWLESGPAQVDIVRLNADVAGRLQRLGFATGPADTTWEPGVIGTRGACRLLVRNGDRGRELAPVFRIEGASYGPVLIGYRGKWTARPAGIRSTLERVVQDGFARIGTSLPRPAVLALARSEACPDIRPALDGVKVTAFRRTEPNALMER